MYIIENRFKRGARPKRVFTKASEAENYISKVIKHNSFTTASVSKLTETETHITIWDTMY
jgi:hypothetical protein